ncbi:MAG: electron transport complex subunit RsxB [Gammaproteobacteria bacterium]|nr:electron transport complex subunit RsxB [Gammaproteobacteria bacterium]
MFEALIAITVLAILFGLLLGFSSIRFKVEGDPIADQIDSILPQTQCGQCGYPGCRPYAEAIAKGKAPINQCPPGGEAVIHALSDLLGVDPIPLDEELEVKEEKTVVVIDEQICIGCTLCIQACPVDAILGAAKHMHTVIKSECTGCNLCIPPCPVDCIYIVPAEEGIKSWKWSIPEAPLEHSPIEIVAPEGAENGI